MSLWHRKGSVFCGACCGDRGSQESARGWADAAGERWWVRELLCPCSWCSCPAHRPWWPRRAGGWAACLGKQLELPGTPRASPCTPGPSAQIRHREMRSRGSGGAAAVVLTLSQEAGLSTDHLSLCAGLGKSRLLPAWEDSPAHGKNYSP